MKIYDKMNKKNNMIIKEINNNNINNKIINKNNNKMNDENNYIIAEFDNKEWIQNIRIINNYEQYKGKNNKDSILIEDEKNEKEIKENCIIKIDNKIIEFNYFYKFNKGKNKIEYIFKNNIKKQIICLVVVHL